MHRKAWNIVLYLVDPSYIYITHYICPRQHIGPELHRCYEMLWMFHFRGSYGWSVGCKVWALCLFEETAGGETETQRDREKEGVSHCARQKHRHRETERQREREERETEHPQDNRFLA